MAGRLKGKVAVVTGAAPRGEGVGNGMATAILFAREGARVVLVNRSAERAEKLAKQIKDEGGEASVFAGDVAQADAAEAMAEFVHPVVRTHPATGREALFVNRVYAIRFEDMTEEESAPLLNYLFQHQVRPEFTCRFTWRPGSIALWDNRCTQHNPVNDYHGHKRLMHRVTLQGDVPR